MLHNELLCSPDKIAFVPQTVGPALLRLQSTAEGVHIMSQSNLDASFKVNLREPRENRDTRSIPPRQERVNSAGTQIPYPVLQDAEEAHKHVSPLVMPEDKVLPRTQAAQEAREYETRCSNFTAAKELAGRTDRQGGDKRLYEAVFSSTCTHRVCHLSLCLTTGELAELAHLLALQVLKLFSIS